MIDLFLLLLFLSLFLKACINITNTKWNLIQYEQNYYFHFEEKQYFQL